MFASSCKKDEDNDVLSCTELTAEFSAATQLFADNPEDAGACLDYKTAAQAYLDAECIIGGNAATLQASVDSIDCSNLGG